MRLELAVDEAAHRWRPAPEWTALAHRLVNGWGPSDGVVEFVVTGDETLHRLNQEYRGKDQATDVLSFSYLEDHRSAREALLRGQAARDFSDAIPDEDPEVLVGQILVSMDTVESRGTREGRTQEEELLFLLTHGLLHVLGFDHVEDRDALEMEARERELLAPVLREARAEAGGEES